MLSIIVATSLNHVIGKNNELPWHISEDLKRFKKITTGHPIIMGRKTYESIGRPLPNRRNMVITRNPDLTIEGVEVIHHLSEVEKLISDSEEVFIIGGAEIYQQALASQSITKIYLTLVHQDIEGDAFFKDDWKSDFHEIEKSDLYENSSGIKFQFIDYQRNS